MSAQWEPTCELRRFDDTSKLTAPRLQQKWRYMADGICLGEEWRDVPLVWEKKKENADDGSEVSR